MYKAIMKKWTEALRSGEYSQTKGALCSPRGNSFCCLGVLCNLYCEEKNVDFDSLFPLDNFEVVTNGKKAALQDALETSYLPIEVSEWAGIKSQYPLNQLAEKNDDGMKFKKIADEIEDMYDVGLL